MMVEYHGTHSFLLNQFLSPASNHRDDRYGGSTENRARILREILRRAREKIGDDYILGLRMSAEDYLEDGLRLEESIAMLRMFVEDGLDVVHVSVGGMDSGSRMLQEAGNGNLIRLAGEVRQQVAIPVIGVGGILNLEQAERAIQDGFADMVAMGRALIADPALITKTLDDRISAVIECTGCLQCYMPGDKPGLTCPENTNL